MLEDTRGSQKIKFPILLPPNNNNNNNNNNQCMRREMSQCYGIKQYTQTEKLQQTGQI
jgi:hypothetical protein